MEVIYCRTDASDTMRLKKKKKKTIYVIENLGVDINSNRISIILIIHYCVFSIRRK